MEIYIIIAAALLLLAVIYAVFRRSRAGGSGGSVLLIGECEAGKTSVLYTLLYGVSAARVTVTSLQENCHTLTLGGKSLAVVDVPGHPRIRGQSWGRHGAGCRAVALVLDSATLGERLRDVAGILYPVLCELSARQTPVAVVCHKADLAGAWDPKRVQQALEQEIELVRSTSSANRLSSPSPSLPLPPSTPFTFSALPSPPSFVASSTRQEGGLQAVEDWLASVA